MAYSSLSALQRLGSIAHRARIQHALMLIRIRPFNSTAMRGVAVVTIIPSMMIGNIAITVPTGVRRWRSNKLSHARFFHTTSLLRTQQVNAPEFPDSVAEGEVKLTCKIGDYFHVDQVVMEIETDKTAIPVTTPVSGVIEELLVSNGQTVKSKQPLFKIRAQAGGPAQQSASTEKTSGAPPVASASVKAAEQKPPPPPPAAKPPTPPSTSPPPVAKPPSSAPPSSAKSKPPPVTPAPPAPPSPPQHQSPAPVSKSSDAPKSPQKDKTLSADYKPTITGARTERRIPMPRIRRVIAKRLKEAQNTNCMLVTYNEVDLTNAMKFRKRQQTAFQGKYGVKLGFMSIFMKACAYALMDQPIVNAIINKDVTEIIYNDYVDISVAVSTPKGLTVPVIRNVETMSYGDIELAVGEMAAKARKGTLRPDDTKGGTFTVSNGGVFGSLISSPIINMPQSAILGMNGIVDRPVVQSKKIAVRPMMYLSLSYDHRLIDNREAALFLKKLKDSLEDPGIMLAGV